MCGAFRTKRRRTGGLKTRAGSENGAVSKNGVFNKRRVLSKNDALDSSGVRQNAATPLRRRAKLNGLSAGHMLETCVHYFRSLPRNTNKTTDRDAGCFDALCRPRGARSDRALRLGPAESAAAARGRSRVSGFDSKDRSRP